MSHWLKFARRVTTLAVATGVLAMLTISSSAQDTAAIDALTNQTKLTIDTVWVLLTGFLVFFMQCGFAMLEAGLIRHTGVVNALLENFIDAGVTAIAFWGVGFGLAFGVSNGGLFGTTLFMPGMAEMNMSIGEVNPGFAWANINVLTMFFFQFAFAATASTITTGAMAERTDFVGDLVYSLIAGAIIYPIAVHWVWGGGWLGSAGFLDFAGSTVVHTVGGCMALTGALLLGPRKGRVFGNPPKPHNLGLAVLGTMILWFGWYGFNPGSTLGAWGQTGLIGLVILNTTLAAASGSVVAMFVMFFRTKKWDLSYALNGTLAGLVGVTAGCAFVSPMAALIIGAVAGGIVIFAVDLLEILKIDDPVGARAVHGVCGVLGTLAIGLWAEPSLMIVGTNAGKAGLFLSGSFDVLLTQGTGSLAVIAWTTVTSILMFGGLKLVNRLRITTHGEEMGIDAYEHGASIWSDVVVAIDPAATK